MQSVMIFSAFSESGSKHIISGSPTKCILLLPLGRYLLPLTALNRHQPKDSNRQFFFYIKEYTFWQIQTVSVNHTTFGFCHDSLYSPNSEKIIFGKLNCDSRVD